MLKKIISGEARKMVSDLLLKLTIYVSESCSSETHNPQLLLQQEYIKLESLSDLILEFFSLGTIGHMEMDYN
jgi:hypothetical protein